MRRIHVEEVVASVQASVGDLLPPGELRRIVTALAAALNEQQMADRRAQRDTRITPGIAAESEEEGMA
jgi:hypothetical protein